MFEEIDLIPTFAYGSIEFVSNSVVRKNFHTTKRGNFEELNFSVTKDEIYEHLNTND